MSFSVANKRVVVIGAGRSGRAAADLLASRGARVTLADTNTNALDGAPALRTPGVALDLGPHRSELLASADLIVLSPGVSPSERAIAEAREHGVPVIGEVEMASRWLLGRMVAITGTKGKSTTTSLTTRMFKEGGFDVTAGGNLGTALSEQVSASHADAVHVVEVSSFQLETTETFRPWIAALLNLSPDHLDRHASFDDYAAAKARIFKQQEASDWAVVNADDPASVALARDARAQRFEFALDAPIAMGITLESGFIVERRNGESLPLVPVTSVKLPGRHLLADVLAATAISRVAGVAPQALQRAIEGFNGLEHALERVGAVSGVIFINDSKATNVISARRAIESCGQGVVVIMGGRYKGGEFRDLRDAVRGRAAAIITMGEASELIRVALEDLVPVHHAASMSEAVARAFTLASPGATVLLAPACSSFDMFQDYAARGRAFKDDVRRLRETSDRGVLL